MNNTNIFNGFKGVFEKSTLVTSLTPIRLKSRRMIAPIDVTRKKD
jgi:hypothetical protein